jgi:hypothetical protein
MKRCRKCGRTKALTEFYREKGCRDGHRPECKARNLAARKAWYGKNREREIARVKAWQQANPERVNAAHRARRRADPQRQRDGHLRRTFGFSVAEDDRMIAAQGGGCAVCGRKPRKGSSLHVDHDHETGEVRGLLCFRCNGGLGQFADDVDRLESAAHYLAAAGVVPEHARNLRAVALVRAGGLVAASG